MRKPMLLLAALAGAILFTGCKKDGSAADGTTVTVDFEDAQLLTQTGNYLPKYDNILWGAEMAEMDADGNNVYEGIIYTEDGADFGSNYNDNAATDYPGDYWGGFAISSNDDKENLADYSNQFSVYASSASTFAIGYDTSYAGSASEYDIPTIEFAVPRNVISARIANANKAYHYCVANPKGAAGEKDILFELVATGYKIDAAGGKDIETGEVRVTLASGTDVLSDWREVSFAPLGEVEKIVFSFESNDTSEWGNNVPMFFCLDDLQMQD